MRKIKPDLISSLRTLGLFESEAKVYAALVMFKNAGAKDLIDYLDISRPSVYESLKGLEERGLIVKLNNKPLAYQAISPDIAMKMLADVYVQAAERAAKDLRELENANVKDATAEAIWSIYGNDTIGYKIKDMIRHASVSIKWVIPDKYIDYLEQATNRGVKICLIVLSDDPQVKEKINRILVSDDVSISQLTASRLLDAFVRFRLGGKPELEPVLRESMSGLDMKNTFLLLTDDSELLYIPPVKGNAISALNTTNQGFILVSKFLFTAACGDGADLH